MKFLLTALILSVYVIGGCTQQPSKPINSYPQVSPLPAIADAALIENLRNTSNVKKESDNPIEAKTNNPDTSANAWQIIVQGKGFTQDISNTQVDKYLAWYTGRQRYFNAIGIRAQLYMAHIIDELKRHDLPLELALLPFIESAYNPFAHSSSGAAGLWQFIRPTGDHLGLKRDNWYDGRRDIISSTSAAARYLKYLNKRFEGDWLLTLAAYNTGEGNVSKAIRANLRAGKPTDFWSLHLPAETRAYIPKLIALAQVTAAPENYQLVLPDIPSEIYFDVIDLPQQIDLYQVSLLAKMSLDSVYRLNPGLQRSATPPGGPYRLLIPKHKKVDFQTRLSNTPKDEWLRTLEHKVQPGDTLSEIAQRYKASVKSLMSENNMSSSRIRIGHVLKIVSSRAVPPPRFVLPIKHYKVRSGDSLWKIARAYQVKIKNLAQWNNLDLKATLKVGMKLKIYSSKRQRQNRKLSYTVRKGDSLSLISKHFKISINDIVRWKKLDA